MSKSKRMDIDGIFGIVNDNRTKVQIVITFSLYSKDQKREGGGEIDSELRFWVFSKRECDFFLRSRLIRLLDFFGPRRKVVL